MSERPKSNRKPPAAVASSDPGLVELEFVERLLELLNRSDAGSIEISKAGTTIRVAKGVAGSPAGHGPLIQAPAPHGVSQATAGTVGDGARAKADADAPGPNLLDIKSPMVGTFYAKPEPGAEPYVRAGSRISLGQTLCIIEAMKIMNPLDAEVAGVVRQIAVDDAQPVEFGQVLFRVDPNG